MELVKGIKIFKMGDTDWVYAPDEASARKVMVEMIGEEDVKEYVDGEIKELTDQEFKDGWMYFDESGQLGRHESNKTPYIECLDYFLGGDPVSGHFCSSEF